MSLTIKITVNFQFSIGIWTVTIFYSWYVRFKLKRVDKRDGGKSRDSKIIIIITAVRNNKFIRRGDENVDKSKNNKYHGIYQML